MDQMYSDLWLGTHELTGHTFLKLTTFETFIPKVNCDKLNILLKQMLKKTENKEFFVSKGFYSTFSSQVRFEQLMIKRQNIQA